MCGSIASVDLDHLSPRDLKKCVCVVGGGGVCTIASIELDHQIAKRSFLVRRWVTIVDSITIRLDASEQEVISVGVGGTMDHS